MLSRVSQRRDRSIRWVFNRSERARLIHRPSDVAWADTSKLRADVRPGRCSQGIATGCCTRRIGRTAVGCINERGGPTTECPARALEWRRETRTPWDVDEIHGPVWRIGSYDYPRRWANHLTGLSIDIKAARKPAYMSCSRREIATYLWYTLYVYTHIHSVMRWKLAVYPSREK